MKKYILGKDWSYERFREVFTNELWLNQLHKEMLDYLQEKENEVLRGSKEGRFVVILGLLLRGGTELYDEPELYYNQNVEVEKIGEELFSFSILKELLVLGVGFFFKKDEVKILLTSGPYPPIRIVLFKANECILDKKLSDVDTAQQVRETLLQVVLESSVSQVGTVCEQLCEFWAQYWEYLDNLIKKRLDEQDLEELVKKIEKGKLD
jgi:hypothetical protein